MVIQFNNQHIKEAENFSVQLDTIQKIKNFLKVLFGLVGLCVFAVILSPLLLLLVWRLTAVTNKILREIKEEKETLKNSITNGEFSFEEVIELEKSVKRISSKIESVAFFKERNLKPLTKLISNLRAIYKEMSEMEKIIHGSYVYTIEELKLSPEELKEYMDQFKGLEDIWDYESSVADKEVVFNHKKQLLNP